MYFWYLAQNLGQRLRRKFGRSTGAGCIFGQPDFFLNHQLLNRNLIRPALKSIYRLN
jgi:hypothetical protein